MSERIGFFICHCGINIGSIVAETQRRGLEVSAETQRMLLELLRTVGGAIGDALGDRAGIEHAALDGAVLAHTQRRTALRIGRNVAFDRTVNMATALEVQVAVDPGIAAGCR